MRKLQFCILIFISVFFLWAAPDVWNFTPDSGIYIGTAESIVKDGRYWFNGHPNLQYYPGFSGLLSIFIFIFGTNFHVLHMLTAGIVVSSLWLTKAYFPSFRYGIAGLIVPVLLACNSQLQYQAFRILSDGTFLAITIGALLLWRIYSEKLDRRALAACFLLVAIAPLVRFHGLFLCAAFAIALIINTFRNGRPSFASLALSFFLGSFCLLPFAIWTLRNVILFTPDTFNIANATFFGLRGLSLYSPDAFLRVDWIDAEWKYVLFRSVHSIRGLGQFTFGSSILGSMGLTLVSSLVVCLVAIGSRRWFRHATRMEQVYIFISAAYLAKYILLVKSTHFVGRYWLPLIPFLLISASLGFGLIYKRLSKTPARYFSMFATVLLITLILINGFNSFFDLKNKNSDYKNDNEVIAKVASFVKENTNKDVSVVTTDWGVMPRALERRSYPILRDDSHILTLERINKHKAQYLVVPNVRPDGRYARRMVEDLPDLFTLLYEVDHSDSEKHAAAVYAIDLIAIDSFLKDKGRMLKNKAEMDKSLKLNLR